MPSIVVHSFHQNLSYSSVAQFFCGAAIRNGSDTLHPNPRSKINEAAVGWYKNIASIQGLCVVCEALPYTILSGRNDRSHLITEPDGHGRKAPSRAVAWDAPALALQLHGAWGSLNLIRCLVSDRSSKEEKDMGRAGS